MSRVGSIVSQYSAGGIIFRAIDYLCIVANVALQVQRDQC